MKKLLFLLLAILLFCPALAAADGAAYHPGDTFEAVFTVTDNPQGAENIMAQLEYDPFIFQPLPSQGLYRNSGVTFSGDSVAVSFQISPYAPYGTYEIGMTVLDAVKGKDKDLKVTIPAVKIRVVENVAFEYKIENGKAIIKKYIGPGGNVVIPDTLGGKPVCAIGSSAFKYCNNLISVTIPDSVTSIGDYTFYDCSSMISATIPDSVTSIGTNAFFNCSSLTSVFIPNSVTSIGISAFSHCKALTNVTIPDSVTSIGYSAFSDCSKLTSVTISKNVTSIGNDTFRNCSSLSSVTIPSKVKRIGYYAFYNCSNLKSVTIPSSVKKIEENAFLNCSKSLIITVKNNSYVVKYCITNKFNYKKTQ